MVARFCILISVSWLTQVTEMIGIVNILQRYTKCLNRRSFVDQTTTTVSINYSKQTLKISRQYKNMVFIKDNWIPVAVLYEKKVDPVKKTEIKIEGNTATLTTWPPVLSHGSN